MKGFLKLFSAAFIGIAVTLTGLFLGYAVYDKVPKELPETVYAEPVPKAEPVVGENTVVKYIYSYTQDGEQVFFEEMAPERLQGLNAEEVKNALRGYEVCELNENRLVVKKEINGRSNTYYSIGEKDGYVAVFFENGILKEKTATPVEGLEEEVKAQISKGIKIQGKENLARCLEDIETS